MNNLYKLVLYALLTKFPVLDCVNSIAKVSGKNVEI